MLNRLIYLYRKRSNSDIYQFSPIRTGSTVVYNLLREVLSNRRIIKVHTIEKFNIHRWPIVCTFRHPLDSLASSILRFDMGISDQIIEDHIIKLLDGGFSDILNVINNSNILFLRYEEFYQDLNIVFDKFESYFDLSISGLQRERLINKYNIESIIESTNSYSSFEEFDRVTHFHGKHVSPFKGKPGLYSEVFSSRQINDLEKKFSQQLLYLGYR